MHSNTLWTHLQRFIHAYTHINSKKKRGETKKGTITQVKPLTLRIIEPIVQAAK